MTPAQSHTRRGFTQKILGFLGFLFLPFPTQSHSRFRNFATLIKAAGNASSEEKCLSYLRYALKLPNLSEADRELVETLVGFVDKWVHGKVHFEQAEKKPKRYLASFITRASKPGNWVLPKLPKDHIMNPLIAWYRARLLVHNLLQHGDIQGIPEVREKYVEEIQALLRVAKEAFPQNRIIGMYLGEAIPWETSYPESNAPQWAKDQREILEKLREILHWWVDNRQVEDGQFGGGWGDDVEMWRLWMPILVGFKDEKLIHAQEKLSKGLFAQKHMKGGYTSKITDVEHTAEDSADTCTAMMHVAPTDETWKNRALRLVELMKTLWTGRNERGLLQFKSTYFTSEKVDETPRKACDTVYHPRAIQPALLEWQRSGNPETEKLVLDWMDTWVEATAREEKGKPAGIIPSAIHWPDGGIGGTTDEWWRPGNYTSNPLYVWPSAMRMMVNTLLLAYHKSGEKKYLEPIFSMAKIYRTYLETDPQPQNPQKGTKAWCASNMGSFMPGVLAKYRSLTGDTQFDSIIAQSGDGYVKYILTGKTDALFAALKQQKGVFSRDKAAFTTDVRWTDRVFRFHPGFLNHVSDKPLPRFDPELLFSMITGNIGNRLYFPLNAVRWLTEAQNIAVWVKQADTKSFSAELYHFGEEEREIVVEFLLLEEGEYEMELKINDSMISTKNIEISGKEKSFHIKIPQKSLCHTTITPHN